MKYWNLSLTKEGYLINYHKQEWYKQDRLEAWQDISFSTLDPYGSWFWCWEIRFLDQSLNLESAFTKARQILQDTDTFTIEEQTFERLSSQILKDNASVNAALFLKLCRQHFGEWLWDENVEPKHKEILQQLQELTKGAVY